MKTTLVSIAALIGVILFDSSCFRNCVVEWLSKTVPQDMEDEIEIDLDRPDLKRKRSTTSREILKILSGSDVCIMFCKLKSIDRKMSLDQEVMMKLHQFVQKFCESDYFIENDFQPFLTRFLGNVDTPAVDLHIRCLSYADEIDLDHYRELFSYSKVYKLFTDVIKGIFTEETECRYLSLLIRLLNNSKLAYKSMLPVIKKLSLYIDQGIAERNIVGCCVALSSIVENCSEVVGEVLVASLISYLVQMLYEPQSYIFLDYKSSKILSKTVKVLCGFKFQNMDARTASIGLAREAVQSIKEYSRSTVYEEAMVVVVMTEVLSDLLQLGIRYGNTSFDFIDKHLFSFMVAERQRNSSNDSRSNSKASPIRFGSSTEQTNSLDVHFERPFTHNYNAQFQTLRDDFITSKYTFLDYFGKARYDRIVFYNDLAKIENSSKLFRSLNHTKSNIDWSDMIVYACNSPSREFYVPFLFDDYFVGLPSHTIYLNIFLKNLENGTENNRRILVYCTKYAIKHKLMSQLSSIYLIGLEQEDNISRKKRKMILEFINSFGNESKQQSTGDELEIDPVKSKEVVVRIKSRKIPETEMTERLKNITITEVVPDNEKKRRVQNITSFDALFFIGNLIAYSEIQEFVDALIKNPGYRADKNLAILLMVIATKRLDSDLAERLFTKTMSILTEAAPSEDSLSCICSLISNLYGMEYFNENRQVDGFYDLLVSVMCFTTGKYSVEYIDLVKKQGFYPLLRLRLEKIAEIQGVYLFDEGKSRYIEEYKRILRIINSGFEHHTE